MNDFQKQLFEKWTKERLPNNFAVFDEANKIHEKTMKNKLGGEMQILYYMIVDIENMVNNSGFEKKRSEIIDGLKRITSMIEKDYDEYLG